MKFDNAVVLVTGANRGLGRAIVEASLSAGARRVYAAAREIDQLDSLVRRAPDRVVPIALDVTNAAMLEAASARASDVTVLVNNAGVLASGSVLSASPDEMQRDLATNFLGPIAVTKAFLPALERAGGAAIVNVLSVASLASVPPLGGYSASKAAAYSATQALRRELASKRIAVHGVFAGPIDTDMVRDMPMEKTQPEAVARAILEAVEQGVEDIAPDPVSRELLAMWSRDPKAVERQLGSM